MAFRNDGVNIGDVFNMYRQPGVDLAKGISTAGDDLATGIINYKKKQEELAQQADAVNLLHSYKAGGYQSVLGAIKNGKNADLALNLYKTGIAEVEANRRGALENLQLQNQQSLQDFLSKHGTDLLTAEVQPSLTVAEERHQPYMEEVPVTGADGAAVIDPATGKPKTTFQMKYRTISPEVTRANPAFALIHNLGLDNPDPTKRPALSPQVIQSIIAANEAAKGQANKEVERSRQSYGVSGPEGVILEDQMRQMLKKREEAPTVDAMRSFLLGRPGADAATIKGLTPALIEDEYKRAKGLEDKMTYSAEIERRNKETASARLKEKDDMRKALGDSLRAYVPDSLKDAPPEVLARIGPRIAEAKIAADLKAGKPADPEKFYEVAKSSESLARRTLLDALGLNPLLGDRLPPPKVTDPDEPGYEVWKAWNSPGIAPLKKDYEESASRMQRALSMVGDKYEGTATPAPAAPAKAPAGKTADAPAKEPGGLTGYPVALERAFKATLSPEARAEFNQLDNGEKERVLRARGFLK